MIEPKPIRVLHIITRMIVGGAQENTLLSVEGLDRMPQYDVILLSGIDTGREGELLTRAEQTTKLIVLPQLARAINPFDELIVLRELYKIIRQGRYHIVHTHSAKAGVLGRFAAWMARTPIIIHTMHGVGFHDYQPWIINRGWKLIERICAPLTDYFISVSDSTTEKAVAAKIDRREKFKTIYSGMELDWYLNAKVDGNAVRREFGIPEDAPVVGKVARLTYQKNHDKLIDAAPEIVRRHPNVRFFLIGDGPLHEHVKERIRKAGIFENFVFAGLIDRSRIPEMISAMDMLVHTARYEGLARVLPQALAMSKPCVSLEADGAQEVIIPGETGYLVQPDDIAGLADAVSKVLSDKDLRQRMGENGRKLVDPMFRAETMVEQIAEVYEMLLQKYAKRIVRFNEKTKKSVLTIEHQNIGRLSSTDDLQA